MKLAYLWIFFTCLLCITCSKKEERPVRLNSFPRSNSPLVGAWWFRSQGIEFLQIVFYPDGSCLSNLFGVGSYKASPTIIEVVSADRKFNFPYILRDEYLQIQLPLPLGNVTFRRVPDSWLSLLRGRYCGSGEMDITSADETVVEFDGRGAYTMKGTIGLYWVDDEGVHLIITDGLYWGQSQFNAIFGNDGIISTFVGQGGTFTRCK
jgi:hypothetical protein